MSDLAEIRRRKREQPPVQAAAGPIPPPRQEAVPLAAVVPAPQGLAVQARVIPPVARVGAEVAVVLGTGRSQKGHPAEEKRKGAPPLDLQKFTLAG